VSSHIVCLGGYATPPQGAQFQNAVDPVTLCEAHGAQVIRADFHE
jgi:hypothetical protein